VNSQWLLLQSSDQQPMTFAMIVRLTFRGYSFGFAVGVCRFPIVKRLAVGVWQH
jgi:hypothetical protein